MSYSDLTVHDRLGSYAGTESEAAALAFMASRGRPLARFGFDRVSTADAVVATYPNVIRHTPDFIGPGGKFYEVQACGYDRTLTFKLEKLEALARWQEFANAPVRFLLYIQAEQTMLCATWDAVLSAIHEPECERVVLDAGSQRPKEAVRVPLSALLRFEVVDAFDAANAAHKR